MLLLNIAVVFYIPSAQLQAKGLCFAAAAVWVHAFMHIVGRSLLYATWVLQAAQHFAHHMFVKLVGFEVYVN